MTPAIAWRPAWPTSWPQVNRAVERLRDGVADALGAKLVGLYLGGSLALGGFDRGSSDIDVLVATARKPGRWRGQVLIRDDFDELPPEVAAAFRGERP